MAYMATYDQMGSRVPGTTGVWPPAIVLGMLFRVTSSIARNGWTGSVVTAKVYREAAYTGSYTCSLWESSSRTLLTYSFIDTGSGAKWESSSFTPTPISMDTDYLIAYYTIGRGTYSQSFNSSPWMSNSYWNPLYTPQLGGLYQYTGSAATPVGLIFPTSSRQITWYGVDVVISGSELYYGACNETDGLPITTTRAVSGFLRGINVGHGSADGNTPLGKYYEVGATRSMSEGVSSAPSLCLQFPGMWRFRWEVKSGTRKISVMSKQSGSITGYTPTLTVKSNPSIGLLSDVSASAAESVTWTTIGPVTITPTVSGVVWVELRNNDTYHFLSPVYFDNITTT